MGFVNPSYLWALWGLLLPLAIHLWSRREPGTLKVGSVEFMEEAPSRRSSRVAINEWALLLVRLAIVALAVLFMAGPQWRVRDRADAVAYLVEPSLAGDPSIMPILDSLADGAQVLLLSEGFPPWEPGMDKTDRGAPPYWQLVAQMDSLPPDSLVVFARARLSGIQGIRPGTHKKIHWVVQEGEGQVETPLYARRNGQDLLGISLLSKPQGTRYGVRPLSPDLVKAQGDSLGLSLGDSFVLLPLMDVDPLKVHVHTNVDPEPQMPYLEAALRAVSTYMGRKIELQRYGPGEGTGQAGDLNLWLREGPLDGPPGRWLVQREDPMARGLIEPKGDSLHHLTARLTTQNTVEGHFAGQLLGLLWSDPLPKDRVAALDRRQMALDQFRPNYTPTKGERTAVRTLDIGPWLLLALALLLGAERIIAKIRKQ